MRQFNNYTVSAVNMQLVTFIKFYLTCSWSTKEDYELFAYCKIKPQAF